jgi:hypothetical protein
VCEEKTKKEMVMGVRIVSKGALHQASYCRLWLRRQSLDFVTVRISLLQSTGSENARHILQSTWRRDDKTVRPLTHRLATVLTNFNTWKHLIKQSSSPSHHHHQRYNS